MKCLVLGGFGFVGWHFVRRLVDDGHDVQVVDDLSSGQIPENLTFKPRSGFWISDLRTWVRTAPNDYDLIVHCAAVVGGRLKIEGDPLAVATDLAIDADLFNWITRHPPKADKQKVIYFSSSAVYPVELQRHNTKCFLSELLVDLNASRFSMPDASYGWSKLSGEYLAQQAVKKYGADVVIYRPFSGYGEDQSLDYPFPSIIRRVVSKEDPIVVWGSGDQVRDWIHIDDIVEGVLQTMNVLRPGEALNLGSGVGTSFRALARLICEEAGSNADVLSDPSRPEGVFNRVADAHKMEQLYRPKVTLQEGIRRSLDFHRRLG